MPISNMALKPHLKYTNIIWINVKDWIFDLWAWLKNKWLVFIM